MVDVFISYSRSDQQAVAQLARMVEAEGYKVWWDADLPPHQSYGDVITAKISAARAAIVVWSAASAQSEWVRAEADMARNQKKLIQTSLDDIMPPLPFNQIQYAPIGDWQGEPDHLGWRKVKTSLAELCGERAGSIPPPPAYAAAPVYAPAPVAAPAATSRWPLLAGIAVGVIGIGAAVAMYLASADKEEVPQPAPTQSPAAPDAPASDAPDTAAPPVAANAPPTVDASTNLPPVIFDLTATVEDPDGFVNVRRAPSISAAIVNRVQVGERFATYQQAGTWWRVKLADGTTGFIARSRIRLPGEETATPTPTPTPTATATPLPTATLAPNLRLRREAIRLREQAATQ